MEPKGYHGVTMEITCSCQRATMELPQRPWRSHRATMDQPWSDHRATMERPWSYNGATMEPSWSYHGATGLSWSDHRDKMQLPQSDHGATIERPWRSHRAIMEQPWRYHVATIELTCTLYSVQYSHVGATLSSLDLQLFSSHLRPSGPLSFLSTVGICIGNTVVAHTPRVLQSLISGVPYTAIQIGVDKGVLSEIVNFARSEKNRQAKSAGNIRTEI